MASCPTEIGKTASSLKWKKFNGKKFNCKKFCQMPATMKNFYSESFSHEYFQQWIFPNYGMYTCDMYVYYIIWTNTNGQK